MVGKPVPILNLCFTWVPPDLEGLREGGWEPWLLLKRPNPGDSVLFTFLLSFAFEAAPHWWIGGAL